MRRIKLFNLGLWPLGLVFVLSGCVGNSENSTVLRSLRVSPDVADDFNVAGGEQLKLMGEGFTSATKVTVGGQECRIQGSPTSQELVCTTPALEGAGLKDLVVKDGLLTQTFVRKIKYNLVLGQDSVSARTSMGTHKGLNGVYSISTTGGKLVAADPGNNRVLIWTNSIAASFQAPDLVLGQSNFDTRYSDLAGGGISASSLKSPYHVFTDGVRVIVSDAGNNRVLIWTSFPTRNGQPADIVLGQPDFTSALANRDGILTTTSASGLRGPRGVAYDGTRLYVADNQNNRVLIWNTLPTENGKAADVVLGQGSMTDVGTNAGPLTAPCGGGTTGRNLCSLHTPTGIHITSSRVYVADTGNHRILVWTSLPTANQQPANFVIGQSSVTAGSSAGGPNTAPCGGVAGLNKCSLSGPRGVTEIGTTALAVADLANNRILIYSPIPSANTPAAAYVIGQSTFVSNSANQGGSVSAQTLNQPSFVAADGTQLWAADSSNNRILRWGSVPTSDGVAADLVLGQKEMDSSVVNFYDIPSTPLTLNEPYTGTLKGNRLFVMDRSNRRVLIWNSLPKTNNQMPDVVLGQPDFVSGKRNNGPNTAACGGVSGVNRCSIGEAIGMATDGNRLIIADRGNNRVLIWNQIPSTHQQPADLVLGQPDFISSSVNNGPNTPECGGTSGRNACSLNSPIGVSYDGERLYVADNANHRILVWTSFPTQNQQPADLVLGQPDFLSGTSRNGPNSLACGGSSGTNACSLIYPIDVYSKNGRLIVADLYDNRVVGWNSPPTVNQQPADFVLGQPDIFTGTSGISDSKMNAPSSAIIMEERLYVADRYNNRIMVWNIDGLVTGAAAKAVFGQSRFTTGNRASDTLGSAHTMSDPVYLSGDEGLLAIAEQAGNRVILRVAKPDFESEAF